MEQPLQVSTLEEAIAWLSESTGKPWTRNRLFDAVLQSGRLTLLAAPPIEVRAAIFEFVAGEGMVCRHQVGWAMALLYPIHVAQVWQTGETETAHAVGEEQEGFYRWFPEPVKIALDQVRVSRAVLLEMAKRPSPKGTQLSDPTPKNAHTTVFLEVQDAAINEFIDQDKSYPKKAEVVAWIEFQLSLRGITNPSNMAKSMETAISPRAWVPNKLTKRSRGSKA